MSAEQQDLMVDGNWVPGVESSGRRERSRRTVEQTASSDGLLHVGAEATEVPIDHATNMIEEQNINLFTVSAKTRKKFLTILKQRSLH
jgi:hypothetical protein